MTDPDPHDHLGEIIRYNRRICTVIVLVALASYGVAYYVWTLGQTLGAIVIATMGYLLFRSLRKVAFNLAWQHFNDRTEYHPLIQQLDSTLLAQREATIREHIATRVETPFSQGNS